jgi:hypothetical protein
VLPAPSALLLMVVPKLLLQDPQQPGQPQQPQQQLVVW